MHCLFLLFTCTFVTCYIKYQSINQSIICDRLRQRQVASRRHEPRARAQLQWTIDSLRQYNKYWKYLRSIQVSAHACSGHIVVEKQLACRDAKKNYRAVTFLTENFVSKVRQNFVKEFQNIQCELSLTSLSLCVLLRPGSGVLWWPCLCVCSLRVRVRPQVYLKNHKSELHQIFCICYVRLPWRPLNALNIAYAICFCRRVSRIFIFARIDVFLPLKMSIWTASLCWKFSHIQIRWS